MYGVCSYPVATITWRASISPAEVRSRQPPGPRSMRWTMVAHRMSSPPACLSMCSTTWYRDGNVGVPRGYRRFGRWENCLPVLSFSRHSAFATTTPPARRGREQRPSHRGRAGSMPRICRPSPRQQPPPNTSTRSSLFTDEPTIGPRSKERSACPVRQSRSASSSPVRFAAEDSRLTCEVVTTAPTLYQCT